MLIKKSRDRIFQPHHTLSLFQTLSPNVHKCPNPKQFHQDEKMCQSSSAARSRPFEISHSRKTVEFFHPKVAIIHAHSAKPILNQNNQTNLTRYVSLSRVPLLPYTVAYGNSIPEETNARFGRLWKFVLPKPIDQIVVVLSHQPLVIY